MGYFTLYAAKMGCRVMAFEPLPRLFSFIKVSLELNGLTGIFFCSFFLTTPDLVTIVEAAVSDQAGNAYMDAVCSELGFSHVSDSAGAGTCPVVFA